eukprot:CAMPEP_0172923046 /NCGR_PEP_ID=MMETSP1075-20121228/209017_1 /TAXON_ID=2916 /ORGANISM="Ceratium fusus, Strain PA161109" /LENGTH=48 /DNA_ID= /DNA_START= /DNA_END= /DNA_ORIENTATION=
MTDCPVNRDAKRGDRQLRKRRQDPEFHLWTQGAGQRAAPPLGWENRSQ